MQLTRFPKNDIISLVGEAPRYDLGESVGPDLQLAELLNAADLDEMALGYGTVAGDPRLREAIAAMYDVDADDVIITVGGIHALFLIAFILCNRGDEAVTTSPLFPQARNALDVVGAKVHTLQLSFDQGYQLDPADLRKHLSPSTRLVSLASPQNPSGVAIPPHVLSEILALLEEVCPQAYLLVDETYREAAYGNNPVAKSAVALSPKIISVTSLSKCHGAPGLRLGWAITRDPALREQLLLGKFNTVISCSPLCETLALSVLTQSESIIAERRQLLAAGRAKTAEWVRENGELVDWVQPDAGAICCVRLKPAAFDDNAVSRFYDALAREDTRVANGSWFGDEARVFRLGFGLLSLPDLEVALKALTKALKQTARTSA
ncbi:aminotransferase [Reticulibacter mediterranei]|uniref:Aminotransferase n=1 Tax=Reticulibacter mediterranei TaxID=2778369 RepID=A0A8J3ITF1_9CHLR|nr:pyridoxal phosphate-dependent aminotransferase [Reticulibacter mediterranei]GHO98263.1 aminotransferase [Reticulibacter mediterranei]